jgi:peptidoglycan/xylan/chitin deacetylase (PgdA/CDA1 family)
MPPIPVLMYHDIGPKPVGGFAAISVAIDKFAQQMAHLTDHGWQSLTMDQYRAVRAGTFAAPRRSVLITFDDGYRSILSNALPIMARHGLVGTVFIVTGQIGQPAHWTGEPATIVRATLDDSEITTLIKSGFDIGAHAHTHPDLTHLSDNRLKQEVAQSVDLLKARFGITDPAFAYPFGVHDDRTRELVARYASLGFTTDDGMNGDHTNAWMLRRTMVQPHNPLLDFRLQLKLGYSPLERLRRLKRRVQ